MQEAGGKQSTRQMKFGMEDWMVVNIELERMWKEAVK
jgi:hypothetical protein